VLRSSFSEYSALRAQLPYVDLQGIERLSGVILNEANCLSRGNLLLGQADVLRKADGEGAGVGAAIQEAWANEYGSAFSRPMPFGKNTVVITDPKAIAHFYGSGEVSVHAER
jgi:hypothetical protein